MTRIIVADEHVIVRAGLRVILETYPGWEVVAEAANGKDAILRTVETGADVAVVAYSLPILNGVEVTRQIRASSPGTEVLIFTKHDDTSVMGELLKAGARGYVLKSEPTEHLIEAVELLAAHKPYFAPAASEALLDAFLRNANGSQSPLTPRERGIVQLIAEGHTNNQIGGILNISTKTVETHRATVLRKLDISSSADLVRYAVRNMLTEA